MGNFPPLIDTLTTRVRDTQSKRGQVFRGDVRSANWDGGGDLSSGLDTTATSGYLLDYSSGAIQTTAIYAQGGDLGTLSVTGYITMATNGVIRTASSGQRIEISNADRNVLMFYSGDASENYPGRIVESTNGSGDTRTVQFATYTPRLDQTVGTQVDAIGAFAIRSGSPDGTSTAPGFVFGTAATESGGGQPLEIRIQNSIPLITDGNVKLIGATERLTISNLGSASSPSIAIGALLTDGIYSSAAGSIDVTAGGTKRLAVNATRVRAVNTSFLGVPIKTTTGDPSSAIEGDMYLNTLDNKLRIYADATWRDVLVW